jgi:hypothetical protein
MLYPLVTPEERGRRGKARLLKYRETRASGTDRRARTCNLTELAARPDQIRATLGTRGGGRLPHDPKRTWLRKALQREAR